MSGQHSGFRVASVLLLVMTVALTLGATAYCQVTTPAFERMIDEFDVQLPVVTQAALVVSQPPIMIPLALIFIAALVAKEIFLRNVILCLVINNIALVLLVVAFIVHREALRYPISQLMESLS